MKPFSPTRTETKTLRVFSDRAPMLLECGRTLGPVDIAYETYGTLNANGDNAILICHALTGTADAAGKEAGWWEPLIGPGRVFDTDTHFIVCSNILGSCYGSTGPGSIDPATGRPYGLSLPPITVRDMVRAQKELLNRLHITSLQTIAGGSLGGMQVLEWALLYPEMVRSIIPIATAAKHSAWCIGLDDIQRQAIMNDPDWRGGDYHEIGQPTRGLSVARQIAMVTYRTDISFERRFGRETIREAGTVDTFAPLLDKRFQSESYLRYQGEKLVNRFDANTYLYITRAMDMHDVGHGRGGWEQALSTIQIPALCVGIDTDILYPPHEQQSIAKAIPSATYREIRSPHGHDAFLIEFDQVSEIISTFLAARRSA